MSIDHAYILQDDLYGNHIQVVIQEDISFPFATYRYVIRRGRERWKSVGIGQELISYI
jgi:hypothetical protein